MSPNTVTVADLSKRSGVSRDTIYMLLSRRLLAREDGRHIDGEQADVFCALVRAGISAPTAAKLSGSGRVSLLADGSIVIVPVAAEFACLLPT